MVKYRIPFNKPAIVGKELYYIAQSVLSGHTAGDGVFTKRCEALLQSHLGASQVLLTTSCTSALEMAAILCDVQPGDEVILPSYTFVSTANAFFLRGASLRFVDIRADTLNIDEDAVAEAITPQTKVIVPVHYAGVGSNMSKIMDVRQRNGLLVVEDAAQGLNAKYKGEFLGTIGDLGTFSFHETKNFICGEGGALVVKRRDYQARAEIIREKGTNRTQFFRGEVEKYTWVDVGSSFLPSDILAAFLYAQLEQMEEISLRRRHIFEYYQAALQPLVERGILTLPTIPRDCEPNFHMFYVLLSKAELRPSLISHLRSKGVLAVFHYIPLHTSPMGQRMGYRRGEFPITEDVSARLLRLPMYLELQEDELSLVIDEVFRFFGVSVH